MNYPLISEYIEAVKNAEDNFDALNHLRPVLDTNGEPIMTSGNFAVVFKMVNNLTGKFYAIKCFLKEQEGRAEAYRLISKELEYVSSTFLTPIKYLDKELFVDSQSSTDTEFPVLQMDWVEGETLDKYIRKHIDDKYELEKLAYQFSRLAMWLMPQPFAHGDLKPDNILVRDDGMLILVDYDGMFVPAMQGQKARELGSPDFRHPLRTEEDFNEHIDDFSIVSILLSLKAISIQPDLLNKYCASDRLLLSEKDYRDISQCTLLKELYPSTDSELNILLSLFTLALEKKNLSSVSFRLFDLAQPKEVVKPVVSEPINTRVTNDEWENAWTDEFGVKYSKDGTRLLGRVHSLPPNQFSYTLLPGTKVICDNAFDMNSLCKVTIPNSVTNIGYKAFYHSSFLHEIIIPDSVTSIGDKAFSDCESLEEITIPDSVTSIGNRVFENCKSLKEITIPDSITSIGNRAFENCKSLKEITIPDSVTSIGNWAFLGCESIKEITIPVSVTSIGDNPFGGCRDLKNIYSFSKHFVFRDNALYTADMTKIIAHVEKSIFFIIPSRTNSFIIPNSVTNIGNGAFRHCESIKKISIPDSVTRIGEHAFSSCTSLKEITIPNTVTNIGNWAFNDCVSLKKIIIPHGTRTKFEKMLPYRKLVEQ